ncbi:hypothetical protein SAMD00019534_068030 [Acytostelium subglobosum LB1]|uniref:hypothetical protein n=1 Tax=Acytostelium subglobosum LB1 TaxID=1410327 RepID=UPI00064503EE|nr:hypothetical protein SAMD00019534_068030 [Acytostelium subglobosum LB1]GAM23628.1 hypothetical protein SAMD00019534_068030 [Acytostelium subglobosum LB1]|eukprot:XP_012753369.1 hypothetical protein SAMD00019534_068030 [Acytostelium subglobosum LB1]
MITIMDKQLLIIKCGGAYLTKKSTIHTLNNDNLTYLVSIIHTLLNKKVNNGQLQQYNIILIIGAGSFGHFEAKEYKITSGYNDEEYRSAEGMVKTRHSVLRLLMAVTQACLERGIKAMPVSPFDSWLTDNNQVIQHNASMITTMLGMGLMPILHGDVCLDKTKGCTILSGDIIIQELCRHNGPSRAIFITDVDGVFDRTPSEHGAKLIPLINLSTGSSSNQHDQVSTSSTLEHDVTGGMKAKLQSAFNIAHMGIDVVIIGGNDTDILNYLEQGSGQETHSRGTIITNKE